MKVSPEKIGLILLLIIMLGVGFWLLPRKRTFSTYVDRAQEAFQKKDFSQAIKLYLRALKYYPNNDKTPEILLNIGDIYNFSMGNIEKAGLAYDMLADRFPGTVESRQGYQHAAEMYEKNEQYQKALLSYQGIIDNFPQAGDLDEVRFKVAMMALRLKKYEPARRSLMAIIETNPETPIADRVLYQLGSIFFMQGASRESIQVLEVAVEKYPESPLLIDMKFTLANAYEERGLLEKALKIYLEIKDQYPNPAVIEKKIEKIQERSAQQTQMKKKLEAAKSSAKQQKRSTLPKSALDLKPTQFLKENQAIPTSPPKSLNNADSALRP